MSSTDVASLSNTAVLLAGLLVTLPLPAAAHWPGQPEHQFADLGEFQFEDGGSIGNLRMSYVTHGKLNAAKDNAILFMHGWAGTIIRGPPDRPGQAAGHRQVLHHLP